MKKKPVIDMLQMVLLPLGSALSFPYTIMPILNTPPHNQDVWVVCIVSLIYLVVMNFPILFLVNKFRGFNVNEIMETILGKPLGKLASLVLVAYFFSCVIICMLVTVYFIHQYLFIETPTWALTVYMLVPAAFAAYKGAGVIGRLSVLIVPFVLITVTLFFILGTSKMDMKELLPVLKDSTFAEVNMGAFFTASRYAEVLIFFVFSFFLGKQVKINKTYAVSVGMYIGFYLLMLIPTLTVLGVELAQHAANPYYQFTRQVQVLEILERVNALNMLAWFPNVILKLTLNSFMASYVFSGIVKAKTHKWFVLGFVVLAFLVCLVPFITKASTLIYLSSDSFFPFIVLPATFVLPWILFIVYVIRRKKLGEVIQTKRLQGA